MRRGLATAVALLVSAAACSGTSANERAVEAVTEGMIGDRQFSAVDITEEEATCVGESLVEQLGAEVVLDFDTGDDEFIRSLNQVEIDAMGKALEDCVGTIEQVVVDALALNLQAPGLSRTPTAAESRCVAEAVAAEISLARLMVIGRSTSADQPDLNSLTEVEARAFGDAYVDCTDFRASTLEQLEASGWGPAQVECFDAELTDDALAEFLAASFRNEEAPNPFTDAEEACS